MKAKKNTAMRCLAVSLTDEEVRDRSEQLARATMEEAAKVAEMDVLAEEHKLHKKEQEKGLEAIAARRMQLARDVTTRAVERDVLCSWHHDIDRGIAILVRDDLNIAVESRELSDKERQLVIGQELADADEAQLELWAAQLAEKQAPHVELGDLAESEALGNQNEAVAGLISAEYDPEPEDPDPFGFDKDDPEPPNSGSLDLPPEPEL